MATVPSYGANQVAQSSNSGARFEATPIRDATGQQLEQLGSAMTSTGSTLNNIALDMQHQVNQVRVDDGLNKIRQQALDLTYNPQTGYRTLKGDAALTRPDGANLSDEYGKKLQTSISEVAGSLGNEQQRMAFSQQANGLMTQFQSGVQQHTLDEYKNYAVSTQDGTIKLGMDEARTNWNDPDKIKASLDSVKAAVYKMGSLQGWSGNDTAARMKMTTSGVHMGIIEAAMQNDNPEYGLGYMNAHKGEMTADDILKTTGLVNHAVDGRAALAAVHAATVDLSHTIAPTDMDRLHGIVLGMESGGNDLGPDGKILTSPAGAKGRMQVMDATLQNPGFGLPNMPANATPEQRAQHGQLYLDAMVKHYGNPAQAMAAYNAGPGRLDEAIAAARKAGTPEAWLSLLPKETQAYVTTGMAKLGAGGGAAPFPTESQFVNTALAKLGDNPRISQVSMAREQAIAQFNMLDKSRKEQGDQAMQQAQQALIQNGGSMAQLPADLKAAVVRYAPDKFDNLTQFAGSVANPVRNDDLAAYNQARSHPEELAAMSDAQFQSFITQRFTTSTAREMVKYREDEKDGKNATGPASLNTKAVDRVLNESLDNLKIPRSPGPKDQNARERLGGIRAFVDRSILDAQKESGNKMTADEINKHVNNLFSKDVSFKQTLWYGGTEATAQRLMTMQMGDLPAGAAEGLRKSLIASGNKTPTPDEIMNLYRRMHTNKQ